MVLLRTYAYNSYCHCGSSGKERHRLYVSVPSAADSPCSQAEYSALRRELYERNSQRDELLLEITRLREKNKTYRRGLEREEKVRATSLQAMHSTQSLLQQEKQMLQSHLALLLQELQRREEGVQDQQQEELQAGDTVSVPLESPPSGDPLSPGQTARLPARLRPLVVQVQGLLEDKRQLTSQLTSLQCQVAASEQEQEAAAGQWEEALARLKADNTSLRHDLERLHKHHLGSDGSSVGATDTEKQLEKVLVENAGLQQQVDNLRSITLGTKHGYNPENQRMKLLEEENRRLRTQLDSARTALANKDNDLRTLEMQYREDTTRLTADHLKASRKTRALQYQITSLYAQEPEVLTRYEPVRVEVETEALHTALADAEVERAALTGELERCRKQLGEAQARLPELTSSLAQTQHKVALLEAERDDFRQALLEQDEESRRCREEALLQSERRLSQQSQALRQRHDHVCQGLAAMAPQWRHLVAEYRQLKKEAAAFPSLLQHTLAAARQELLAALQGLADHNKDLVRRYHREMHLRKKYHNELVELKGNIRVFCRVRPVLECDRAEAGSQVVVSYDRDDDALLYLACKGRTTTFEVDRVFPESSTQIQVFEEVRALVTSCIDGYNVCIFAYGQTGSGKTYTMEGPSDDPGINQRALQELFRETAERGQDWHYSISVSMLEIYNETIRDLLNDGQQEKLEVKMSADGGFHVPGLVTVPVSSVSDVNKVFRQGHRNRATATTNMNEHSSRSHALLCVTVTGVNRTTLARATGKLNLVDLAGSERVSKSGADGTRLKEAQNINRSLACLGDVIHALRCKQSHIPYRNSRLTFLLQDSLGGDSKTLMIVQVAPVERHVSETACSLNFAQRVRSVELGAASKRVENGDVENGARTPPSSPGSPVTPTSPRSPLASVASCSTLPRAATPSKTGTPSKTTTPSRGGTPSKTGTPLGLHRSASATTPLSRSTPLRGSRKK